MSEVSRAIKRALLWMQLFPSSAKVLSREPLPITGEYLMTGVEGLLHMSAKGIRRLSRANCFGIARNDREIFVTHCVLLLQGRFLTYSTVLAFDAKCLLEGGPVEPRSVWGQLEQSFNGRAHQIALDGEFLWIANTDKNTLLKVRSDDGSLVLAVAPFADELGVPINGVRLHHINSATAYNGLVFFSAFNPLGGRSLIGVFDDQRLACFAYANEGVHDVHVAGKSVYISDSFGNGGPHDSSGGRVLKDGCSFQPSLFEIPKPYMVRGFAECGQEFVVGLSGLITCGKIGVTHQRGGLAVWDSNNTVRHVLDLPFSQCNDLISIDGTHLNQSSEVVDFKGASLMLENAFGKALFEKPLDRCVVCSGNSLGKER